MYAPAPWAEKTEIARTHPGALTFFSSFSTLIVELPTGGAWGAETVDVAVSETTVVAATAEEATEEATCTG